MTTIRKPTEEQKAAAAEKRAALCRASAPFRAIAQKNRAIQAAVINGADAALIAELLATIPAQYRGCTTINACLEVEYRALTGQQEFHSFKVWKEKGFTVKKGEHGFTIWSTPKHMTIEREAAEEGADPERIEIERFALSYLFHAGQVEPIIAA